MFWHPNQRWWIDVETELAVKTDPFFYFSFSDYYVATRHRAALGGTPVRGATHARSSVLATITLRRDTEHRSVCNVAACEH